MTDRNTLFSIVLNKQKRLFQMPKDAGKWFKSQDPVPIVRLFCVLCNIGSIFDREFVKTGKIDKHYSEILHDIFDARLGKVIIRNVLK